MSYDQCVTCVAEGRWQFDDIACVQRDGKWYCAEHDPKRAVQKTFVIERPAISACAMTSGVAAAALISSDDRGKHASGHPRKWSTRKRVSR